MIFVLEMDVRKHNGKRWCWKPLCFKGLWNGKRTWRIGWGLWTISYYPSPGLREFMDRVRSGKTGWHYK